MLYFFNRDKTAVMLRLIFSIASLLVGTPSRRETVIGKRMVSGSPLSSPFPTTVIVLIEVSTGVSVAQGIVVLVLVAPV
jgi:hypothetical protein